MLKFQLSSIKVQTPVRDSYFFLFILTK